MKTQTLRTPRKRPQQARSRATVAAILEAGARVLVEHGYARASTNRIAQVAGVSIGSLYEFFPSKDAIFTEIRRRLNDQMLELMGGAMRGVQEMPIPEAVRAGVSTLIAAHCVNPALESALREQVPEHAVADQDERIQGLMHELALSFGRRHRAELRPANLDVAAFVSMWAAESLAREAANRSPRLAASATFLDEVSDLLTRYLMKDPPGPAATEKA